MHDLLGCMQFFQIIPQIYTQSESIKFLRFTKNYFFAGAETLRFLRGLEPTGQHAPDILSEQPLIYESDPIKHDWKKVEDFYIGGKCMAWLYRASWKHAIKLHLYNIIILRKMTGFLKMFDFIKIQILSLL